MDKQFADKLLETIKKKGITRIKIAEVTGIDYQRLIRILRQEVSTKAWEFLSLCAFLGIEPRDYTPTIED